MANLPSVFVNRAATFQTVGVKSVVVQKYGGTSVADPDRIRAVADRVRDTRAAGHDLVVVVSAMGETTDGLLALAEQVTRQPPPREMDMLLTAGERITMALLAMALSDRGIDAVSYTGSQAGILTDSSHGGARITRITGERVMESLDQGKVVIVAGFQGVDPQRREVTTLGRGGSDTTAVALAATLGAEACEILTDVDGVYTADPRVVPHARKLDEISYRDMLALAEAGAGVLMPQSVEHAMAHRVSVHVRSSLTAEAGTWLRPDADPRPLAGIAHRVLDDGSGVLTVVGADAAAATRRVVKALEETGMEVIPLEEGKNTASLGIPPLRIEAALHLAHDELFGGERGPS